MLFRNLVIACLLSGCASSPNQAELAYNGTPIFGKSRRLITAENREIYTFAYRGGRALFFPGVGGLWVPFAGKEDFLLAGEGETPSHRVLAPPDALDNGCLVFACATAEAIRAGSNPLLSRAQVVTYQLDKGSGHAFALFDVGAIPYASDNTGVFIKMPKWSRRTDSTAERLSRHFHKTAKGADKRNVVGGSFIGTF